MGTARCSRCHRPLTEPRHAAAGLGPTCAAKLGLEFKRPERKPRAPKAARSRKASTGRSQLAVTPTLPFEEWQGREHVIAAVDEVEP